MTEITPESDQDNLGNSGRQLTLPSAIAGSSLGLVDHWHANIEHGKRQERVSELIPKRIPRSEPFRRYKIRIRASARRVDALLPGRSANKTLGPTGLRRFVSRRRI